MAITAALAAGLWLSGCQEEILEEEVVPLEISYEAVEGVIPNGSATAVPEITSGEPSEFKISEMFHSETDYEGSEFTIDPETGTVSIQGADDTDTGEYLITITCVSGGRSYILKNALSVTFISGMPQISMSQRTINVKYEDLQTGSDAELATSQVNASGVAAAIEGYELRNVRFRGLMGMATFTDDETVIRSDFSRIYELFNEISRAVSNDSGLSRLKDFTELSIGMSEDYRIALEYGSTMVRIGTMIFGPREY